MLTGQYVYFAGTHGEGWEAAPPKPFRCGKIIAEPGSNKILVQWVPIDGRATKGCPATIVSADNHMEFFATLRVVRRRARMAREAPTAEGGNADPSANELIEELRHMAEAGPLDEA